MEWGLTFVNTLTRQQFYDKKKKGTEKKTETTSGVNYALSS